MDKCSAILVDSEILGGRPVFAGTRVPIDALYDYIETGSTIQEFLIAFPSVTEEQAVLVLEYSRKLAVA